MAEPISIQQLKDASLDVKSLEEVVNGDENVVVTTRLGETYPSVKGSTKKVFENGGLPATPFKTKALMTASSLANDQYAMVTDDTDNNGLYVKTAGTWVKSDYDPLTQAKAYADSNPLFKPLELSSSANANELESGVFVIKSDTIANSMTGLPPIEFKNKSGTIFSHKVGGAAYQKYVNTSTEEMWERVGNGGGSSSFAWREWQKVVGRTEFDSNMDFLKSELRLKPSLNLFKNIELTSFGASEYEATLTTEDNKPILDMNNKDLAIVYYEHKIDGKYLKAGATVTLIADIFTDKVGSSGGDISLQALSSTGSVINSSSSARGSKVNVWEQLTINYTIPESTTTLRVRFIKRLASSVVKFRSPILSSSTIYANSIVPNADNNAGTTNTTVYVSKSGGDNNNGSASSPYLNIQKAVNSIPDGGNIIVLDDAEYRESIIISSSGHIKIAAVSGKRVNIFGSDKLVVTKTSGMTKVYQAPLAAKPTGMGGSRGQPVIFEWGTPSKPIVEAERHHLHRGLTHRLPYTEMFEANSKAELDTVNGKWFWEDGIIYFSSTDGGDATLNRYEARVRPVLTHSNGSIELVRVTSWFSSADGMLFDGVATKRTSCVAYGAHKNGFADNANFTESYKDISGGNGNDGFNATVADFTTNPEINDRLEQTYFDPYGHDNGDDGISDHYRSDCTVYGGYFEYNTKADVVHVTGSNSVCYDTQTRGTLHGFYVATNPDGDVSRIKTVMRCVNTKSHGNRYSYRASGSSELHLDNCIAINPLTRAFEQDGSGAIYATDCRTVGATSKEKLGNVVVLNTTPLIS